MARNDDTPTDTGPAVDAYRELFERSADAILIIEGERFVDCNEATVRMLRLPDKETVLRTHPSELSPEFQPDGRKSYDKANEMIGLAFEQGSHRFEWDHRRGDGEVFPVEVLLTAMEARDPPTLHVVWRDITERRRLETELRQAQKMEAIGNLAGGIAHDFNNLLVVILGNLELLQPTLAKLDDAQLTAQVQDIHTASQRAAELTRQLLAYGRRQVLQPRVIDLAAVVEDLDRMLRRVIGEDITLETRIPDDPVPIEADPGQLQRVVLNLATNARDAMPDGGTLSLEIRRQQLDADTAGVPDGLAPGAYAILEVSDTGTGMDEETLERIFDPFFTTRGPHEGTGLGLSTAHGIVRQSGGDIRVHSLPSRGTTFQIFLPTASVAPSPTASTPDPAPVGRESNEEILVVEDEAAVSMLLRRVLTRAGYRVECASNGVEGLAALRARDRDFDLIVSDVIMPKMGGPEMIREFAHPDTKVLFVSGYTDDALDRRGGLEAEFELIRKPFAAEDLLARVRAILDR